MKKKQYAKEIYREIEICSKCGECMIKQDDVVLSAPLLYKWKCPKCGECITTTNGGEVQIKWKTIK